MIEFIILIIVILLAVVTFKVIKIESNINSIEMNIEKQVCRELISQSTSTAELNEKITELTDVSERSLVELTEIREVAKEYYIRNLMNQEDRKILEESK